jgi:hypothetical protein
MDIIWDDDNYTDDMMILMEDDSDYEEEDVAEAPMVAGTPAACVGEWFLCWQEAKHQKTPSVVLTSIVPRFLG